MSAELSNDFAGRDGVIRARLLEQLERAAAKGSSESEILTDLPPGVAADEARAALRQLAAGGLDKLEATLERGGAVVARSGLLLATAS